MLIFFSKICKGGYMLFYKYYDEYRKELVRIVIWLSFIIKGLELLMFYNFLEVEFSLVDLIWIKFRIRDSIVCERIFEVLMVDKVGIYYVMIGSRLVFCYRIYICLEDCWFYVCVDDIFFIGRLLLFM